MHLCCVYCVFKIILIVKLLEYNQNFFLSTFFFVKENKNNDNILRLKDVTLKKLKQNIDLYCVQ